MRRKRRASFGRFCKEFFKPLGSSEETDNFTFNVWRVHRHCRIKCDRVQQGAAVELRWAAKPIDLRTVYPHGESAYVSAAAVAPVEGVQRLVQSGGQRQKPYVCAISSRRWQSAGPGALWLAIVTGRPISRKNRPNRIGTTKSNTRTRRIRFANRA
jgi:hypothetical protein